MLLPLRPAYHRRRRANADKLNQDISVMYRAALPYLLERRLCQKTALPVIVERENR